MEFEAIERVHHFDETSEQESVRTTKFHEFEDNISLYAIKSLDTEIDLCAPDPAEDAERQFLYEQREANPTFYVVPELADYAQEGIVGVTPLTSRSGNASYHGVFFAEMHFADGSAVSVAVKPHDIGEEQDYSRNEHSCLKDYFTNITAKKMGFESLQPIGFILDEEGTQYSITKLEEDLDTLDTMKWTSFFEDGFNNYGMKDHLYKAALYAAMLHQTGDSYHGDMAVRNIATNSEGHVFLIDWEHGKLTNQPAHDIDARFGNTLRDIKGLMASMSRPPNLKFNPGIGIFEHSDDWWADFKDIFLDDYMEARLLHAEQGSHHTKNLRATQDELVQLEHTLHLEMERLENSFSKHKVSTA